MLRKIFIFFVLTFSIFLNQVHAKNGLLSSDLSIKELSSNIEKIKTEQANLELKTENQSKEYWDLLWFIKQNLTKTETQDIKDEINEYIDVTTQLDEDLKNNALNEAQSSDIKQEILTQKIDLYRFLYDYIDENKKDDFINYIKINLKATKERKELLEELAKNQLLLDKKVSEIKDQIETHKEDLNSKLDDIITKKIVERINLIDNNEKYKKIDQKTKNDIYKWFINTIKNKIKDVENSDLSKNYKEMRIKILNKMIVEIQAKIK